MERKNHWKNRLVTAVIVAAMLAGMICLARGCAVPAAFDTACRWVLWLGLAALTVLLWTDKRQRPERLFPWIALFLGLFMAVVITPFSVPDELFHYQETLQLSDYLLFRGGEEREVFAAYLDYSGLTGHHNTSAGLSRVLAELFLPLADRETVTVARIGLAYPLEYLPQAVGMSIARVLGGNFITIFFAGRVTGLLFYVLCLHTALERMPRCKLLLGTIGITPMVLQQAASLSYDNWIYALSFLYLASLCKAMWGSGPIPRRDLLWVVVSGILLSPARAVNAILMLLFWLIPAERFGGKRRKLLWMGILLAGTALLVLSTQFDTLASIGSSAAAEESRNWDGGVKYTVSFILAHPGKTALIFLRTLKELSIRWFAQAHGQVLSGLSLPLQWYFPLGYGLLLLLTVFQRRGEEPRLPTEERVSFFAAAVLVVGATMLAMFLAWTSDTREVIDGVQGRYFTPLLPLAYLTVSVRWLPWKEKWDKLIPLAGAFLGVEVICSVLNYTVYWN